MSSKLKCIIFFGAIFGLLGFAHSIRCSDTPIISSLVGWLTICTAAYHFSIEVVLSYRGRLGITDGTAFTAVMTKGFWTENPAAAPAVGSLIFSAVQHAFIYIDAYWLESVSAAIFFVWFYFVLGKAVDG